MKNQHVLLMFLKSILREKYSKILYMSNDNVSDVNVELLKQIIFDRIIKTMRSIIFDNDTILKDHLNDYNRLYPEIILEILYEKNKDNYTIEAIPTKLSLEPKKITKNEDFIKETHFYIPSNENNKINFDNFLKMEFVYITMKKLKIIINYLNETQYTKGNEIIYGYIKLLDKDYIYLEILYQNEFSFFMQENGVTQIPHQYISYITYDPLNTCNINDIPNIWKILKKETPCPLPRSGGRRKSKKKRTKKSKKRRIVSF